MRLPENATQKPKIYKEQIELVFVACMNRVQNTRRIDLFKFETIVLTHNFISLTGMGWW